MLPLGETGDDHPLDIGEHVRERFGLGRRMLGKLGANVARFHDRGHRALLDPFDVVGDPVDQCVAVGPEVVGSHVAERRGAARRPAVRETAVMRILALDVDGVLLDPERAGDGHWTNELERRHGITRPQLRHAFFVRSWDDIVNGRLDIESGLAAALDEIGSTVPVEDVLSCWFDADFVPVGDAVELACRAADAGCRVVLATNQEHRRAAYLGARLGAVVPLDQVIYSADLGVQKHDARFFELASQRLAVDPSDRSSIVFVDDLEHNVEQARAAGWCAEHAVAGADWISRVDQALDLPYRASAP